MKTQIVTDITTTTELQSAVYAALNIATGYAKQIQAIKDAYMETLESADQFKPVEFVNGVAPIACQWFDSVRFQLAEQYGESDTDSWAAMPEYKAIQSGFTAFRQSVARETGGVTFKVSSRVNPTQSLAGDTVSWELDTKKYEAKGEKQDTADAKKNDAPSGEDSGETETSAEKFNGQALVGSLDEKQARSVLLNILNQYPDLTMDKAVKDNYNRNFEKACKKAASLKKLVSKKAA